MKMQKLVMPLVLFSILLYMREKVKNVHVYQKWKFKLLERFWWGYSKEPHSNHGNSAEEKKISKFSGLGNCPKTVQICKPNHDDQILTVFKQFLGVVTSDLFLDCCDVKCNTFEQLVVKLIPIDSIGLKQLLESYGIQPQLVFTFVKIFNLSKGRPQS